MPLLPLIPLIAPPLISIKPHMIQTPLPKLYSLLLKYRSMLHRRPMHNPTIPTMTQFRVQRGRIHRKFDTATVAATVIQGVAVEGVCVGELGAPRMDVGALFILI